MLSPREVSTTRAELPRVIYKDGRLREYDLNEAEAFFLLSHASGLPEQRSVNLFGDEVCFGVLPSEAPLPQCPFHSTFHC